MVRPIWILDRHKHIGIIIKFAMVSGRCIGDVIEIIL
jgi:hypothetical protein